MVKAIYRLSRLIARIWYPVALPEEVAGTLGIQVSNFLSFSELLNVLSNPAFYVTSLSKYMPRQIAEAVFQNATCVEFFKDKTLVSFYFNEGWIEFVLCFDSNNCLRRIYLNHKQVESDPGIEIVLRCSYIGNRFEPLLVENMMTGVSKLQKAS